MAKFLTELDVHCINGDKIWELDASLIYKSDYFKYPIEVPKGFQTDFASVPRIPIVYMLWGNRAHREAVIHDYLYRTDARPLATKQEADLIFYEAMKCRGKAWYVRYPMKWGVQCGGASSYHKRRVEEKL